MAKATMKIVNDSTNEMYKKLLDASKSISGVIARDVYLIYQNAQRKRWMTEGASEGKKWKAINNKYKEQKPKRFASYPGGGRKMLIATYTIFPAVTGENLKYHKRLVQGNTMTITISVPYAKYVNDVRNFSEFGAKTRQEIKDAIRKRLFR